ncbi:hypothetical protein [Streptomyces beijiangensis]|uniref:Uncharacterized protein n=1 Tax=Streptomyces beijiangensis TaxID=163361 RepID=A0A939F1N7_9ACTN|nr:hypothetical protein [Streptomyces beijiangensis]MBO0510861.1 hypothetical protein [Streptomyces beijiangensis]
MRLRNVRILSICLLVAITAASAVVLQWAWSGNPTSNTLHYEAAKTAMQVLAVSVFGSIAAIATFAFNDSRTQAAKERDRERDLRMENWRRQVTTLSDKRDRLDESYRSALDTTLALYHQVKAIRRMLRAETGNQPGGHITLDIYEKRISDLNVQQLEFETLKRQAENHAFGQQDIEESLRKGFVAIESHLGQVITEYETKRSAVAAQPATGLPVSDLPELAKLLTREGFKAGVSAHIDDIVKVIREALLKPLELPDPGADGP